MPTRTNPNPEISALKPEEAGLAGAPWFPAVSTGWIRLAGPLFFGLLVPRLTDLLGKFTWREPEYWQGTAWFLAAAALLWEGNRALLLRLRTALDAYPRLVLRLVLITGACVAYTVPVTIGAVAAWQQVIGAPYAAANWATVSLVTTNTVIAAVLVVQAHEMLLLQQEREQVQLRLARLERARLVAELQATQDQLAPHFLFNCLNTLASLIAEDPRAAAAFNQHLADVSRYLLARRHRDLVPLADELAFLHAYAALMELRFPRSLQVRLVGFDAIARRLLPPAALQTLVENALKHNRFDAAEPLVITIRREAESIAVAHPYRPKAVPAPSSGTGLTNLRERVHLLTGRPVEVTRAEGQFQVRLPLVCADDPDAAHAAARR